MNWPLTLEPTLLVLTTFTGKNWGGKRNVNEVGGPKKHVIFFICVASLD